MNLLERICLWFLILIGSSIIIATMVFTFMVLWQLHPAAAILTFLTVFAVVYLTRNSNITPK